MNVFLTNEYYLLLHQNYDLQTFLMNTVITRVVIRTIIQTQRPVMVAARNGIMPKSKCMI